MGPQSAAAARRQRTARPALLLRPHRLHRNLAERAPPARPVRRAHRPQPARHRHRPGGARRRCRGRPAHGALLRPAGARAGRHHQHPRPARHRAGRRPLAHDPALRPRARAVAALRLLRARSTSRPGCCRPGTAIRAACGARPGCGRVSPTCRPRRQLSETAARRSCAACANAARPVRCAAGSPSPGRSAGARPPPAGRSAWRRRAA